MPAPSTSSLHGAWLFLAALVLTGCGSLLGEPVSAPAAPRTGLDAVNHAIGTGRVTLVLTDSTYYRKATRVTIGEETTRFRTHRGELRSVPTSEVARVEDRRGGGAAAGRVVLGMPLALYGVLVSAVMLNGIGDPELTVAGVVLAGSAAFGASVIGGAIGNTVAPGPVVTLYQAPVERYLEASD